MNPPASSLGDLLRAQIGDTDLAQEFSLASFHGRVLTFHGRDSLLVLHGERFQFGLPDCFASRHTLRIELVPAAG